jgi:hypothetical protein
MKNRYFRKMLLGCLLVCISTALAGCDIRLGELNVGKAEYKLTEQLSAPAKPGGKLEVATEVGSIDIAGSETDQCNVTAVITARAPSVEEAQELAEKVKISLETAGDKIIVKTQKPSKKSNCSIGISYDITVPNQTSLRVSSNVGNIDIAHITGDVKASTNVGNVTCSSFAGDIDGRTNVGNVSVSYSVAAGPAPDVRLETNVGEASFVGPAELSATVDASTQIGSISTSRPLTVKGTINKSVHGTIGDGKGRVKMLTNIGSITIQ